MLEWWKYGSSIARKVHSSKMFSDRLKSFNERIEYLVDHNYDYEAWLNKFYSNNSPDWIAKGKIQMDQYQWMVDKLKHLRYYVHLEDIDLVRELWGIWTP